MKRRLPRVAIFVGSVAFAWVLQDVGGVWAVVGLAIGLVLGPAVYTGQWLWRL